MTRLAQQALWSGRFAGEVDGSTLEFTSSLDVDSRLAFYDVMGSIAHARMLGRQGIVPKADAALIVKGLQGMLDDLDGLASEGGGALEDIHTCVEFRLIERIGPAGGRLHTARSRNDQVATDFRMYARDAVLEAVSAVDSLAAALLDLAEGHVDTVMPGFTHMQHAQPVTLAQHLLAHACRLSRDADRLMDAYARVDLCPLGAAALAGTTYPIDRVWTARALGFAGPTSNSMDSVSDRDFAMELCSDAAICMTHLSSISEELVYWSSPEFGFVEMDDRYSTGSSIMPQKKNPDIAELVRGRAGAAFGALVAELTMAKGLPLAYNRDLQEDKRPLMDSMGTLASCASMLGRAVSAMEVKAGRMREAASEGFANATDLADYLAAKGVPFREAHGIAGAAVRLCIGTGRRLEDLGLDELAALSPAIGGDVYGVLPVDRCVERRGSLGGTSPESARAQIAAARPALEARERWVSRTSARLAGCWARLRGAPGRRNALILYLRAPSFDPVR